MKNIRIVLLMMIVTANLKAQFDHIPPGHEHPGSVCYGYAMGRAFGKTAWINDPGGCNLGTLHPIGQGGEAGSVDPNFFLFSSSVGGIKVGEILAFEQEGSIFGHVAYVSYVGADGKYDIDTIRVDQVPNWLGPEQTNIRLRDVIEGNNGQVERGAPAGKYTKRALWNGTIKNQFSDGTDGGTLRLVIPGVGESHPNSPYSLQNRFWGETITIDAEMANQEVNGLIQTFENWTRSDGQFSATTKETQLPINWPQTETPETKAVFQGTLVLSGTKVIQSGQTVTIDQNTILDIQANSELVVYGRLVVNGTSSQHVVFASPPGTTWKGIKFEGSGANNSSLNYCDINQALSPVVATNVGSLTISNCTISNSSFGGDAALRFYGSAPTITSLAVNGQSNSANGIRFASGSSGSISASTIQNCGAGNGIVIEGNSFPAISNNTITGNKFHGIIANSNPAFPTITGNIITNNGVVGGVKIYTGITFYNSHGNVMSNTVEGSNYGIYADHLAFPRSYTTIPGDPANNLIRDNLYGLVAYDNSEMDFGYHDGSFTYGACNKIYLNSTWDAFANVWSTIISRGTYWLTSPPQKITTANNSTIDYSCYMTSEFNCGSVFCDPSPKLAGNSTTGFDGEAELRQARFARIAGDYQRATGLYANVLSTSALIGERLEALRGIYQVFLQTRSPELIERVASYKSGSGVVAVAAAELEMMMQAGKGNFDAVKQLAAELQSKYPGTETEKKGLILLASLGGFDASQRATSTQALSELKQKYGSTVDAGLLAALGSAGSDEPKTMEETIRSNGLSLSNHPNPFNPMTVIRFTLPVDGDVSLNVFDLLGREVATLVNEFRVAGTHQVNFDAGSLPSGMYLYRLETAGSSIIQKMTIIK